MITQSSEVASTQQRVGLTEPQTRCLEAIKALIARNGLSPTYNELKNELGLRSVSNIHVLVDQLAKRGAIVRRIGTARSLLPLSTRSFCCPHCGKAVDA